MYVQDKDFGRAERSTTCLRPNAHSFSYSYLRANQLNSAALDAIHASEGLY
jgi:hypothetical protein